MSPLAQRWIRRVGAPSTQRPCNGGQVDIRAHPPVEPARDHGPASLGQRPLGYMPPGAAAGRRGMTRGPNALGLEHAPAGLPRSGLGHGELAGASRVCAIPCGRHDARGASRRRPHPRQPRRGPPVLRRNPSAQCVKPNLPVMPPKSGDRALVPGRDPLATAHHRGDGVDRLPRHVDPLASTPSVTAQHEPEIGAMSTWPPAIAAVDRVRLQRNSPWPTERSRTQPRQASCRRARISSEVGRGPAGRAGPGFASCAEGVNGFGLLMRQSRP